MDLSAVQWYCGGRWTGEHCHTDQMLQVMSHILSDELFLELAAAMVNGVPNLLNAELPSEEVATLLSTPKLPTVVKNPDLMDKAILKEERSPLLMDFSSHLTLSTPNLAIIKLGILDKKHKKPRMYRHSSYISEDYTHSINKLVDCELSEPAIGYVNVLKEHAAYLWCFAAQYRGCTIYSYDDDVSRAFPQVNHHLDVGRGNVSVHGNKMIVIVALHFGGNYGPASWEPIARVRCFLAQWMYKNTYHQEELNNEALGLFELPDEDTSKPCTVKPHFNNINKPVFDKDGAFMLEFWIIVDNLLSAIPYHKKNTHQFIASSIESVYILIGYPESI